MTSVGRRNEGWIVGWLLAIGTAAVLAWIILESSLSSPSVGPVQSVRIVGTIFVVALVLALPAVFWVRYRGTDRKIEEFRQLLDLAAGPLLLVDPDGTVRFTSGAIRDVLRQDPAHAVGRPLTDLLPPESQDPIRTLLTEATRPGGGDHSVELAGVRKDGGRLPLRVTARRIEVGGTNLVGIQLRNMTERDELVGALADRAAELARSNRDLEQFAYVASHDLQEPLRMVGSYTQLIQQRYRGKVLDADADEFLTYAQEGATRMREMIENLLAYSRLGTQGRPFQPVSLEKSFDVAVRNLTGPIAACGGKVTHGTLPTIEGDSSQLVQLFQNLMENAIKFRGPQELRIQVDAKRSGPDWIVSIRDNGIGIAPEHQDRIFILFQRLHSREEYPRSGIGLATCKKVVERHGGRIWVESAGTVGSGTTFHFTLPIDRGARVPIRPVAPTGPEAEHSEQARTLIEERLAQLI